MAVSEVLVQLRRGLDAARRLVAFAAGEVAINNDTDHLAGFATIGDGSTAGGIYPGAGNASPGWVTNSWYFTPTSVQAFTTTAMSANTILWQPICVPPSGVRNMKNIGVNVQGAGVGSDKCRLGLYENDDGTPGALVFESGELDVTSTGFKSDVAGTRALKPGWYWLAFVTNGTTATYDTQATLAINSFIGWTAAGTPRPATYFRIFTYAALPDPATPGGITTGVGPLVSVQAV